MNKLKRIRIFGNLLMLFGILAFGIELLNDQNYLPLTPWLGASFICGFGGLGAFVLGAGIAEWSRQAMLHAPKLKPLVSRSSS